MNEKCTDENAFSLRDFSIWCPDCKKIRTLKEYTDEIRQQKGKETFRDIEQTIAHVTGNPNPFSQNYPDKKYVWELLRKKYGVE